MSAQLIFIKRSEEEIKIFGGNVYADIDGRNVGIIENKNLVIDIEKGKHTIKMYKSHNYGSMIGFSEINLDVQENEKLTLKYTCPMTVTQPGHIIVSNFVSYDKIENEVKDEDLNLKNEKRENDIKQMESERKTNENNAWIIILVFIIPAIIWGIYEATILSLL